VTQEVFVRCFGHRPKLSVGRELLAWLYRVTITPSTATPTRQWPRT
jgi:DNA-directed RNA polymerase specialized sigma24 family protein